MPWTVRLSPGRTSAPSTAMLTRVPTNGVSRDDGPEIAVSSSLSAAAPSATSAFVGPPGPLTIWSHLALAASAISTSAISVTSQD
jgi:hypothetical protein